MSSEDPEKETSIATSESDPGQYFSKHWKQVLQILIVLTLGYAALRGLAQTLVNATAQTPAATRYRIEVGGKDSELRIVGWIEQDVAAVRIPLKVQYSFFNLSQEPVQLRLDMFGAPGFTRPAYLRQQLKAGEFPVYLDRSTKPVPSTGATVTVPAGGTSQAQVEIVAYRRTGSSMITSVFGWVDAKKVPRHEAVELGPVRMTSPALQLVSNILDTGTSLAQTVALPLILALLGLFFQYVHENNAQRRQAWASMLPVHHDNNVKIYLPLVSGIETFESWLPKLRKRLKEDKEGQTERRMQDSDAWKGSEAFFFLLFCLRRMREVDKNGWFSLMEKEWESLLSDCWDCFADRLLGRIKPYETLSRVLDFMSPDETFSSLQRKLSRSRAVTLRHSAETVEKQFEEWVGTPESERDFAVLSLMRLILAFEMNQIYRFWYSAVLPFPRQSCEALLETLKGDKELEPLVSEVSAYMNKRITSSSDPPREGVE